MKKRKILLEIFFIFLLSLTPLLWFRPGQLMVGHDNVFPLDPPLFLKDRFYTWTQKYGFGEDQSLIMGTLLIHFIDALPSFLGFSLVATQKIVYVFWFFLLGLSAYVLALTIDRQSRFFRLLIPIFYQFNFFILQGWFIGERTKFSACIALPLVLAVFWRLYREKIGIWRAVALNSLILFFFNAGGVFGIPLYGGFLVTVGLFVFWFSLTSLFRKKYRLSARLILVTILSVLGFFLINSYYFLPAFDQVFGNYSRQLVQKGGVASYINWAKMISVGSGPLNLFRLQGMAEWYDNPQHPYAWFFLNQPALVVISLLWPLLAFSAFVFIKERKKLPLIFYFSLVYLASIFFAGGTHPPLGFLYIFFMRFIPGFAIFRSPFYKFAAGLVLANACLAAFTLDALREKIIVFSRKYPRLKALPGLFALFFLFLIPAYHFPYFTGNFFNWKDNFSTRVEVPEYVFEFGVWANEEKKDNLGMLAVPPPSDAWGYEVYDWGYLSLFALPQLITSQPIFSLDNREAMDEDEKVLLRLTYEALYKGEQENFKKLAAVLNLGYVLVRKDFAYNLDWIKTQDPRDYQEVIEKNFGFPKEREFGKWVVYAIRPNESLPKVYGERELLVVSPFSQYNEIFPRKDIEPKSLVIVEQEEIKNISTLTLPKSFLATCLSCQVERESDFLVFPAVTFLPDSPFYFLVKLQEARLKAKITDPNEKIHHVMGLSLKRTAELRRMLIDSPPKNSKDQIKSVRLFQEVLLEVEDFFAAIVDPDQRFLVAEKLNFYLSTERDELRFNYQQAAMSQEMKDVLEETIQRLDFLIEKIKPYLFNRDLETTKLFSLDISREGKFRFLVRKRSAESILPGQAILSLRIDDQEPITDYQQNNEWFDFGDYFLTQGYHRLWLTLSPFPNLATDWQLVKRRFAEGAKDCFVSRVENFSPQSDYKVKFQYKNVLHEDLVYYEYQDLPDRGQGYFFKPNSFVGLYLRAKEGKRKLSIFPDKKTRFLEIGFCAEDLTREDFEKIFRKIEVKKLVSPLLLVESAASRPENEVEVSFQKINPTKFFVRVKNPNSPFALVFLEKFNDNWQLSPKAALSHFAVFGYANGWLIDKAGDYELMLEYLPQKVFYQGIVLTIIFLLLSILILKFKKRR